MCSNTVQYRMPQPALPPAHLMLRPAWVDTTVVRAPLPTWLVHTRRTPVLQRQDAGQAVRGTFGEAHRAA